MIDLHLQDDMQLLDNDLRIALERIGIYCGRCDGKTITMPDLAISKEGDSLEVSIYLNFFDNPTGKESSLHVHIEKYGLSGKELISSFLSIAANMDEVMELDEEDQISERDIVVLLLLNIRHYLHTDISLGYDIENKYYLIPKQDNSKIDNTVKIEEIPDYIYNHFDIVPIHYQEKKETSSDLTKRFFEFKEF